MRRMPSLFRVPRWLAVVALSFLYLVFMPSIGFCQDRESLGKQAEQAGKFREALTHYTAALGNAPDGSDVDQRLREEIIALVQKMRPAPTVPEEARRHFVIANTHMKDAKAPQDYNRAISEYKQVLVAAAWFGDPSELFWESTCGCKRTRA